MERYRVLANRIHSYNTDDSPERQNIYREKIEKIMESAPSGSGLDSGTQLFWEKSNNQRLAFSTAYHHMNPDGYYDGWTNHIVTVQADLRFGFIIKVSGRDRNDIKDYITDVFHNWLGEEEEW